MVLACSYSPDLKVSYLENMRTIEAATMTSWWRLPVCPLWCLCSLVKSRDWSTWEGRFPTTSRPSDQPDNVGILLVGLAL